jgi:homopolymeric O-antigen transport system permease protein
MPDHSHAASAPLTLIAAGRPAGAAGWRDLWSFRELLYFLVWRDLKVRYKQTVFGAAWAVLQPLTTMVVFAVFFGRLAQMPSDGVPYPLFAYAALVPWTYFASALSTGALSLVGSQHLISKVFFPRLLIPLASVITPLFDALIALALMALLLPWYGYGGRMAMVTLPLFAVLMVGTALGAALWLAALNVKYRDVRYLLPFLVQFWLFLTPVIYPASLVPDAWRFAYGINPMATVVEGFRWSLVGSAAPSIEMITVSVTVVTLAIAGGVGYFRRTEGAFADVI